MTDVQEFMERTSHVLSLIYRNVGVAVAASGPKNALEHVYFSRQRRSKGAGSRGHKIGIWSATGSCALTCLQSDLDAAARFINENFSRMDSRSRT